MESVLKTHVDPREDIEQEIRIKSKTTSQILKSLDSCLGVNKRTKGIIKMYSDYIKLYKQNKIKLGNFNMILYCDNNNYRDTIDVINNLLYKEGVTRFPKYELISELQHSRRYDIGANDLCVITDDCIKDYKLEKFMSNYPNCVFIIVCNSNMQVMDNIRYKFTWEIEIQEPTEEEKIQYIKDNIKEHGLECKVTDEELGAISCYNIEDIDNHLIGAIMRANKKKITYISKEELHIIEIPKNQGMQKLESLVGLDGVKEQVRQIINYVQIHQDRGTLPMLHMAFKGNPRHRENRSRKDNWRDIFRLWHIKW